MKSIITMGRQFGSGGADIGRKLAEKIGGKCYDKEILLEAARKSGICEAIAEQYDEEGQQSFYYSLVTNGQISKNNRYQPINVQLHNEVFQLIRTISEKDESVVFIGRCADYVLQGREDLLKVYISADLDYRVNRIAQKYNLTETDAYKLIQRRDMQREAYYNYFTNKKWSEVGGYDLAINSADLGVDGSVDIILNYLEKKTNR